MVLVGVWVTVTLGVGVLVAVFVGVMVGDGVKLGDGVGVLVAEIGGNWSQLLKLIEFTNDWATV